MWSSSLFVLYATAIGVRAQSIRRKRSFADKLFAQSEQYAMQSLNGRFIQEMATGELANHVFQRYVHQDMLYSNSYSRAFAILAGRADQTDELVWLLNSSLSYLLEHGSTSNVKLPQETFQRDASQVTISYTAFILQAASNEHPIFAYSALLPCQRLYDWLFVKLKSSHNITANNPYKSFIERYADHRNHYASIQLESFLDRHIAQLMTPHMAERAHFYYSQAMQFELAFFNQAFQEPIRTSLRSTRNTARLRRSLSDGPTGFHLGHGKVLLSSGVQDKPPRESHFKLPSQGRGLLAAAVALAVMCSVVVSGPWKL